MLNSADSAPPHKRRATRGAALGGARQGDGFSMSTTRVLGVSSVAALCAALVGSNDRRARGRHGRRDASAALAELASTRAQMRRRPCAPLARRSCCRRARRTAPPRWRLLKHSRGHAKTVPLVSPEQRCARVRPPLVGRCAVGALLAYRRASPQAQKPGRRSCLSWRRDARDAAPHLEWLRRGGSDEPSHSAEAAEPGRAAPGGEPQASIQNAAARRLYEAQQLNDRVLDPGERAVARGTAEAGEVACRDGAIRGAAAATAHQRRPK